MDYIFVTFMIFLPAPPLYEHQALLSSFFSKFFIMSRNSFFHFVSFTINCEEVTGCNIERKCWYMTIPLHFYINYWLFVRWVVDAINFRIYFPLYVDLWMHFINRRSFFSALTKGKRTWKQKCIVFDLIRLFSFFSCHF